MFEESTGMRLRGAYLTFRRRASAHFDAAGVTADQFVVLTIVAAHKSLTQREIVDKVFSDPNTISSVLMRLERMKLVRRERHPDDSRARSVSLTALGRKMQRDLQKSIAFLHIRLDGLFSTEERQLLGSLLARIPAAMAETL